MTLSLIYIIKQFRRLNLSKKLTLNNTFNLYDEALELIEKIIKYYKANAKPHQRIGAMIDKMGFDEFKSVVLGG